MKSLIWTKAIKESADPKRAKHFLDLLGTTTAGGAVKPPPPNKRRHWPRFLAARKPSALC